jgi:hypothetical protein
VCRSGLFSAGAPRQTAKLASWKNVGEEKKLPTLRYVGNDRVNKEDELNGKT